MVVTNYVLHRGELCLVVLTASVLSVVQMHWRNFCHSYESSSAGSALVREAAFKGYTAMLLESGWDSPFVSPERLPASCFPVSTLDASSALGHCSEGCVCSLVVFNDKSKDCSSFKHTDILMELEGP